MVKHNDGVNFSQVHIKAWWVSKATPDCGFGCENSDMLVSGSNLDYGPEGEKNISPFFPTKGFDLSCMWVSYILLTSMVCVGCVCVYIFPVKSLPGELALMEFSQLSVHVEHGKKRSTCYLQKFLPCSRTVKPRIIIIKSVDTVLVKNLPEGVRTLWRAWFNQHDFISRVAQWCND